MPNEPLNVPPPEPFPQMNVPIATDLIPLISALNHTYPEELALHYVVPNAPCNAPGCGYDPVTQLALNVMCPTCGGRGLITTDTVITVPASIDYPDEFTYQYLPAGFSLTGDVMAIVDSYEIGMYDINPETVTYYTWQGSDYILDKMEKGVINGIVYEYDIYLTKKGVQGGE